MVRVMGDCKSSMATAAIMFHSTYEHEYPRYSFPLHEWIGRKGRGHEFFSFLALWEPAEWLFCQLNAIPEYFTSWLRFVLSTMAVFLTWWLAISHLWSLLCIPRELRIIHEWIEREVLREYVMLKIFEAKMGFRKLDQNYGNVGKLMLRAMLIGCAGTICGFSVFAYESNQ